MQSDNLGMGIDMSEARASLLSGDVVELVNATAIDSTSMKLVWEVRCNRLNTFAMKIM